MRWKNIFKGYLMGMCEIIPGVSSGTMALLLGIYRDYLEALGNLASKHWKQSVIFLVPIVIGMGFAMVTALDFLNYLLINHPIQIHWFFIGLIIGVLPMLIKLSRFKTTFKLTHILIMLISFIIVVGLGMIQSSESNVGNIEISMGLLLFLMMSGILGAMVMLLPGISGSLVLLILGAYSIITHAISEFLSFNFGVLPILIATGIGLIIGVIIGSQLITKLFSTFPYFTYAFIIGLVAGSIFAVYRGLPETLLGAVITIGVFTAGFLFSYIMGNVDNQTSEKGDYNGKSSIN